MNLPPISSDPVGKALHFLRMSGTFYSRCEFTAPWGLELPAFRNSLMFHIVMSGRCFLEVEGEEPYLLEQGALFLLPHGEGHRLVSETGISGVPLFDLPREHVGDRYEVLRIDGSGEAVSLVCGAMQFDQLTVGHLIDVLPRVINVDPASSLQKEWMHSTLRFMAAEAMELRPGGESVITRLADVLVIQAIRAWIEQDPGAKIGWLGGLRDRQIGHAIALIHADPAHPWTLMGLASAVAMSRSAFAARFTSLVGESPMHYVARWRMHVAIPLLNEEGATLSEVAPRVGYQSEAAFSRAFKRFMDVSPGSFHKPLASHDKGQPVQPG